MGKFAVQVLTFEIGAQRPLGIGAGSLSLLSAMSSEEAELIISGNGPRYRSFDRTVRESGHPSLKAAAWDTGLSVRTVTPDTIGIGVAVKEPEGRAIAAISVAGTANRMSPKRRKK